MKRAGKKVEREVFWENGGIEEGLKGCQKQIASWTAQNPNSRVYRVGVSLIWDNANKPRIKKVLRPIATPGKAQKDIRYIKVKSKKSDANVNREP